LPISFYLIKLNVFSIENVPFTRILVFLTFRCFAKVLLTL